MVVSRHQNPSVIFTGSHVAAGTGTGVPPGTGVFIVVAGFAGAGDCVFWIVAGILVALAVSPVFNSNRHPAPDMDKEQNQGDRNHRSHVR